MKLVAGVVVLYHPDEEELLRNIKTYLPYLDELFVIDNSANDSDIRNRIAALPGNIHYVDNQKNEGIARSLNMGASFAYEKGYRWLLTMDQDSFFESKDITAFFSDFKNLFYDDPNAAVIGPSAENPLYKPAPGAVYQQVDSVITSGSLHQLTIWKKAGMFDEKLFIDEVDHEYCYRVSVNGFKVYCFPGVKLKHSLGTKKNAGYFGYLAKRTRTIHSPFRVYFMVRNYLYVRSKYRRLLPGVFTARDSELLTALKNNLMFSGQFLQNVKSIVKGYMDYRKGNFSDPK